MEMVNYISRFKSLPVSSKRLISLGAVLAMFVALPLFIWAVVTQTFFINKKAASGEPVPTPICLPRPPCLDKIPACEVVEPVDGWCPYPPPTPYVGPGCIRSGCSGELCVDAGLGEVVSSCRYLDEFACYESARCEQQSDGNCGWTQTPELIQCIHSKTTPSPTPTCLPRPACLDSIPACEMPEPIEGWCATPTPSPTPSPSPTQEPQCIQDTDCREIVCPGGGFVHEVCRNSQCVLLSSCKTPTPSPTSSPVPIAGDVNNDGTVNIIDIGIIIDNYRMTPPADPRADVNHDGIVNIVDIGIVIDNYQF